MISRLTLGILVRNDAGACMKEKPGEKLNLKSSNMKARHGDEVPAGDVFSLQASASAVFQRSGSNIPTFCVGKFLIIRRRLRVRTLYRAPLLQSTNYIRRVIHYRPTRNKLRNVPNSSKSNKIIKSQGDNVCRTFAPEPVVVGLWEMPYFPPKFE
jgi:hypothetical protein